MRWGRVRLATRCAFGCSIAKGRWVWFGRWAQGRRLVVCARCGEVRYGLTAPAVKDGKLLADKSNELAARRGEHAAPGGTIYTKARTGEWVSPLHRGYKMACCDCGLVHTLDFRIVDGRVEFRAERNERSTGQMRRWRRVHGKPVPRRG